MFGPSLRAARCYSPNCRGIYKAFGRAVNSTVRTLVSFGLDGFSATDTDVFRRRAFYSGYVAALYFALVALSKASCDESPSKLGWM
jgi:hypothetical protein